MASKFCKCSSWSPASHRQRLMPSLVTHLLRPGNLWRLTCRASSGGTTRDGSIRRVVVRRPREQIHTQVLHSFARRSIVDPSHLLDHIPDVHDFKFPMQEFRSLALNAVGKLGCLDRGVWNRYKVQLCHLLLLFIHKESLAAPEPSPQSSLASTLATVSDMPTGTPSGRVSEAQSDRCTRTAAQTAVIDGRASCSHGGLPEDSLLGQQADGAEQARALAAETFRGALDEIVDSCLQRDLQHIAKATSDPSVPDEQRGFIQGKHEARRRCIAQQVTKWCECISQQPDFHHVQPFLSRVLDIQPAPLFEQAGRDGRMTEDLVFTLVERELPPGWRLYSGARLLKIGDEVFPNQKFLKGEADLLITDPEGVVQAVLEVKTASGNLFLALSEDVIRFLALMERVRGRDVTFSLSDNTRTTLKFSPHLRPVYVLGCELHPEDLEAVARSAQAKLLTMEVGRMLSSQVQAWGNIDCYELSPTAALLHMSPEVLPQLRDNVYSYFQTLAGCEIYTLQRSAWSQRETLEADRLLEHSLPTSSAPRP